MKKAAKGQRRLSLKNKYLSLLILLLSFGFAQGQTLTSPIVYTPMTAAGYQFKWLKGDSGLTVPFRNLSYGRGTSRPGSLVVNTADSALYYWNGVIWVKLASSTGGGGTFIGIDSVTYNSGFICQWKNGSSTCYPVQPGVDSVTVIGDQLCEWRAGVPNCYTINGNVLGTGLDSVTVIGNQLCQWDSGVSVCYTINTVSPGIDSITVTDSLLCSWSGGFSTCFNIWHEDTIYVENDLTVRRDSLNHQVLGRLRDDGLISGGIVTGAGGMDLDVTVADYVINHVEYFSPQSTITIAASDPLLDRQDLIVVDTFGVVSSIAGIPGANPVLPQHNPGSQIVLTSIYIPAGITSLPINYNKIYDENIEWATSTTGTITTDFDNTNNPHPPTTKAAFTSIYDFGAQIRFTDSGPDTVVNNEILKFWIYLNIPFPSTLSVQFFNGTTPVSTRQVVGASHGFNTLMVDTYQNVSMLLSGFNFTSTVFDRVVFFPSGKDSSGAGGFYLDQIELQTGLIQQGKSYVDSVTRVGDSLYYHKSGIPTFVTSLSTGGVTPTLQQVFNTEVGGSVLTKTDSIQLNGHLLRILSPGVTGSLEFENFFNLHPSDQIYSMGDLNGIEGNRTYLEINDAASSFSLNGFSVPFLTSGWHQNFALPEYRSGGTGVPGFAFEVSDTGRYKPLVIDTTNGNVFQSHWPVPGSSGTVTSVSGTAPILSTGGTTPVISADTSKAPGKLATYSDVTIDKALRRGNTTKQMYLVIDSVATASGSGLNAFELRPQNYGTTYTGTSAGTQAEWEWGTYGHYPGVNASGRPNDVFLIGGYNGGFASKRFSDEPTWGVRAETAYETPSSLMEFHGVGPEFFARDGSGRRLESYYVDRENGFTNETQQTDQYTKYVGATDTVNMQLNGGSVVFGFNQNGGMTLLNNRLPNNNYIAQVGNSGPVFSIGTGTTAAATYFSFTSPAQFTTHATLGTTQTAALQATVGTTNYAGLKIAQSGLSTGNIRGIYADITTTGTYYPTYATNAGTSGNIQSLQATFTGKSMYSMLDATSGATWSMYLLGGTVEKSLKFGTGNDSAFKIRGDNGNAYFKYDLTLGGITTANKMLTASGTPKVVMHQSDSTLTQSSGTSAQVLHGDGVWRDTTAAASSSLTRSTAATLQADTIPLVTFSGGGATAGDTIAFSTSTIYGSFFNNLTDTLVITRLQIGLQGTSPSVTVTVYYNDSLNVTAGATKLVNAGSAATNIYTGTSVTSFDNAKIPPGVWVWLMTTTVTTKPTYLTATLNGYKSRTQ